jgi:hypothetical protein
VFSFFRRKSVEPPPTEEEMRILDIELGHRLEGDEWRDENCSWLADPDDYSEIPRPPRGTVVSQNAGEEYVRKLHLRKEVIPDVDRDIRERKVMYDLDTTHEQREVMINQYARELQRAQNIAELDFQNDQREQVRQDQRNRALVDAVEGASAFSAAKKFAKEHPFITGWVGAGIVHRLRDK